MGLKLVTPQVERGVTDESACRMLPHGLYIIPDSDSGNHDLPLTSKDWSLLVPHTFAVQQQQRDCAGRERGGKRKLIMEVISNQTNYLAPLLRGQICQHAFSLLND